jgi:N-acetylmuramoyl-L-alanine amidase
MIKEICAVAAAATITISSNAFAGSCGPDAEITALAKNMYFEARGKAEGIDGLQMVGEVTLNRVNSHRYPNNVCDVVYQKNQFSWTHELKNHTPKEKGRWIVALQLAEDLINGDVEYFNNGATHYLNPVKVLKKRKKLPRWARVYKVVGKVGNHVFYTDGTS